MLKSYNSEYALADDDFILAYKEVSCDQRHRCHEAKYCGGAQPHMYDPSECGHCPMNKDARCLPVEDSYEELQRQSEMMMEVSVRTGIPIITYRQ